MALLQEQTAYLLGDDDVLEEGINDKSLFKAVFLAGGPGSGKSFVVDRIFSGTGARVVNTDDLFEYLMLKNDVSMKIDSKNKELYERQTGLRTKAKAVTLNKKAMYLNGMLPIIIDGTGKDYEEIVDQANDLRKLGYDTGMVFVNTTLEVAKARNAKRGRSVPEEIVEKGWKEVQSNLGKFQSYFGQDFFIVDNSKVLDGDELEAFSLKMAKIAIKLMDKPLRNAKGLETIDILKKTGGKLISDISEQD